MSESFEDFFLIDLWVVVIFSFFDYYDVEKGRFAAMAWCELFVAVKAVPWRAVPLSRHS